MGSSLLCYISNFVEKGPLVPRKILKGFHHTWTWRPSWSFDQHNIKKNTFSCTRELTYNLNEMAYMFKGREKKLAANEQIKGSFMLFFFLLFFLLFFFGGGGGGQMTSPLKPYGQSKPNFILIPLVKRAIYMCKYIFKMVLVSLPRWPPCHTIHCKYLRKLSSSDKKKNHFILKLCMQHWAIRLKFV